VGGIKLAERPGHGASLDLEQPGAEPDVRVLAAVGMGIVHASLGIRLGMSGLVGVALARAHLAELDALARVNHTGPALGAEGGEGPAALERHSDPEIRGGADHLADLGVRGLVHLCAFARLDQGHDLHVLPADLFDEPGLREDAHGHEELVLGADRQVTPTTAGHQQHDDGPQHRGPPSCARRLGRA